MNLKKLSVLWCCCFAPFGFSKSGYMVACIDDYPPYQYLGAPPHGIHVTALANLANVFNKKIQFIESPNFARCVQLLKTGEIDVIAGLNKNSDREKFAFYAPYRIEEDHVVISKKASDISDYQSIKDKIIGVPRGTTYFKKFNEDTALNKVPIQSIRIGIELIIRNRIDVIITSESVANLLIDDITNANLKATIIKQNSNKEEVSYFGFSKLNKLDLLPAEIINRTTQAFKQGKFKDDVNVINAIVEDK